MKAFIWTFELSLATPLVMGGASPNERAELRVASLRGALRSWHRVLAGAGERALQRELALFGGAGNGQGQGLASLGLGSTRLSSGEHWTRPQQSLGLSYLAYSLVLGENGRGFIAPGDDKRVTLHVAWRRGASEEECAWFLASLWALVHLGGVGTRARRGFGSLGIVEWPQEARGLDGAPSDAPSAAWPFVYVGAALATAASALREGRARLARLLNQEERRPPAAGAPHYFWDESSRVVLWLGAGGRGWKDWREALDKIGTEMMNFRKRPGIDWGAAPTGARRTGARRRTAFGLPLAYRFKRSPNFELVPIIDADSATQAPGDVVGALARQHSRLPSPLSIKLLRCADGYGVLLTRLSGPLPGVDVAVAERGQRGRMAPDPSNRILDEFLDALPGVKQEVGP